MTDLTLRLSSPGQLVARALPYIPGSIIGGAGIVVAALGGVNTIALAPGDQVESLLLFTQAGTGAVQRTLDAKIKESVWVSVTDFGADPSGVIDASLAVFNAITALGNGGGTVFFPAGIYKITTSISIGNGSTAAQSTKAGVRLVGSGNVQGTGTVLKWGGGVTNAAMFAFLGPMKGGGIENILFDGNSTLGGAFKLVAMYEGKFEHIAAQNFTNNLIESVSIASAVSGNASSQFNTFNDIQLFLANVVNTMGIRLDGNGSNAATNTSLNTFNNVAIVFPSVATAMFGLYLRDCDGNLFSNLNMIGGGAGTAALTFDYSGSGGGVWPANNLFIGFDPDGLTGAAAKYLNSGSPASTARPNRFYGVIDGNSAPYPKLSNTTYTPEMVNPGVDITAQTASSGPTNINPIALYLTGMYRLDWYLEVTTTGAGGATLALAFGWTDDAQAQTLTVSTGQSTATKTFAQGSTIIRATTATNITYTATVTGTIGTAQFALHIKLEKLD
jgi:hypothetical protein